MQLPLSRLALAISSLAVSATAVVFYKLSTSKNMASLAAVRASNAAFSPSYVPVAVFVGGTSGIGQAMAENFANYTKGNAHIIIVGRNRAAAESIIARFPKPTIPNVLHEFIHCDATLMKNVHAATSEILSRVPKINFLVMSPGFLTTQGRNETVEGIDRKLAVHYYARWKFVKDLVPTLVKAKDQGEDAGAFSVLAAGRGTQIDLSDLGLKKTYTTRKAAGQACTYTDLMMEVNSSFSIFASYSPQEPGICGPISRHSIYSCIPRCSCHANSRFFPLVGNACCTCTVAHCNISSSNITS